MTARLKLLTNGLTPAQVGTVIFLATCVSLIAALVALWWYRRRRDT